MADFIFLGSKITVDDDCSHKIQRQLLLGRKAMTHLDSILKSGDIADKGLSSQSYGFSSSYVQMWELDLKLGWTLKNWCLQIVMLEKTPESPLDSMEIKPVNSKGNQSWIFIGRTDAEAEAPILWPPDVKNWLIGKDPDAGEDWRQEKRWQDEMVGWHHRLNGHEFEQTVLDSEGQGRLVCFSRWGCKETQLSSWTTNNRDSGSVIWDQ